MSDHGATIAPAEVPVETGRGPADAGSSGRLYGLLAEFDTPAAIYGAAEKVRDAGYRWWDCLTPFPVHGLDRAMGVQPTILPWLVMGAGLTGATLGFVLQWFTNASGFDMWALVWVRGYEFLISGKPLLSGQVYPVVMFELTILLSAIGCVVLLMLLNNLPMLYHPLFKSDRFARASDDRFFILVEARDPKFYREETGDFLASLGPLSVEEIEE